MTHIVIRKFDNETQCIFEKFMEDIKYFPTVDKMPAILLKKHQLLVVIKTQPPKRKSFVVLPKPNKKTCSYCKGEHLLFAFDAFEKLRFEEKCRFAKQQKLNRNCLAHADTRKWNSETRCPECNKKHHSLLHFKKDVRVTKSQGVLLATALVKAFFLDGTSMVLR